MLLGFHFFFPVLIGSYSFKMVICTFVRFVHTKGTHVFDGNTGGNFILINFKILRKHLSCVTINPNNTRLPISKQYTNINGDYQSCMGKFFLLCLLGIFKLDLNLEGWIIIKFSVILLLCASISSSFFFFFPFCKRKLDFDWRAKHWSSVRELI